MKTIAVIIDFDNFFGTDINRINSESLEFAFSEIVNLCEIKFKEFERISIRLYGGWYNEMSLTKQASSLQQLLYNVSVFPKVQNGKIIHGTIEMISELYGVPDFTWGYTYKESNGIKHVRIDFDNVDEICSNNRQTCPKFILYKFTKSKEKTCPVEGCNSIHKNIFKGVEQKMVDTLIACDILTIAEDEVTKGMVIISDDQDHFPSLALAIEKQKAKQIRNLDDIYLVIQNDLKIEFITEFLKPFQIKTILLS
ncbi:MAG TPA: hypothetical protein DCR40_12690 [Prolixibacteraceae bacterium]|nr:hypothetical protein [Prolixibacteraceae bacterium]